MINETLDNLVYEITSRFDNSITPAEARALVATPEEARTITWLFDVLSDVAIDYEKIESLDDIDLERFHGVGLIWSENKNFLFSFDDLRQEVLFKQLPVGGMQTYEQLKPDIETLSEYQVFRFFERERLRTTQSFRESRAIGSFPRFGKTGGMCFRRDLLRC